jgi:hypothetical protein
MTGPKSPDNQTIAARLNEMLKRADELYKQGPRAYGTGEFLNWRRDVVRWLKAGMPYTADLKIPFLNLRFERINEWVSESPVDAWNVAFEQTRHILGTAIENLEQEWATPSATNRSVPAIAGGPSNVIINANIQLNSLTVGQVLDEVASEIEKVDKAQGRGLRERMKKWSENPAVKTILEAGLGAVLKRYVG